MSELERDLMALRDAVAWPQTPDVAAAVRVRVDAVGAAAPGEGARRRPPQRARLALAALVAAAATALAVSPAGGALLRWIGIGATIRVTEVQRLPVPASGTAGLGRLVSLDRARVLADFRVRVPAPPLRVRFSDAVLGGAVTLEYRDTTITQFAGTTTDYLQKVIAPPTRAQRLTVNGNPGVFLTNGPTRLFVADRRGNTLLLGGARPGANVLLWEDDGIALRIETRRDLAGALALARRLR